MMRYISITTTHSLQQINPCLKNRSAKWRNILLVALCPFILWTSAIGGDRLSLTISSESQAFILNSSHPGNLRLPPDGMAISKPVPFPSAQKSVLLASTVIISLLALVISFLIINILQRRRSAIALRASEAKYCDLYENAPDMYCSVDTKTGTIKECNETFLRITGYNREETRGCSIFELFTPDCAEDVKESFRRFARSGNVQSERKVMCKDGRIIDVSIKASAVTDKDGNILYSRAIWRDITEHKRAEDALQKSEEKYRGIVENAKEGFFQTSDEGRFLTVNRAYINMLGYASSKEMVETITDIPHQLFVHPEEHAKLRKLVAEQGSVKNFEAEFYRKDGGRIWVSISMQSVLSNEGHLFYKQGICEDITSRKQIEAEHRRLEERLRRSEKMEALGTLAGGVAHDLNNVLGVLVGYSELLLHKIPEGDPTRNFVDKILASSEKGATIVQDLLTLARRGVTVSEVVDLNRVVSNFIKSPVYDKLQAYHPKVAFRTELSDDLLNIKGSPVHLEKTLMNLTLNAAEAIAEGGEVTIRTENRYLDTALRGYDQVQEGDYVVLAVSDNGGGIQADDLSKIFEPFYTKKVMGRSGTGLGLAVVWGTVKDHNGYIDVVSEEGKGSTFTLYFPVTFEQVGRDQQKVPIEQYRGRGESVLVVDDVCEQREMAADMLTSLGYQAQTVSSGEEAVEYLRTHTVDLIVLDMIMNPGIDGFETYRRVLEINPVQKAILVSGFSETDRVKKALELKAGTYVRKPYMMEKIGLAIRKELLKDTHANA